MGFNGDCKGSVQFHPQDPMVMISYTGCLLVVSRVDDPHQQEFLRGHNEAITCLAISPTGNLIASGQTSTTRVPNSEATVIVWDYATRQPVYRLMELHDGIQFSRNRVQQLAFSPDEAFLAGLLAKIGQLVLAESLPELYLDVCEAEAPHLQE